jgi:gas vesicle protein
MFAKALCERCQGKIEFDAEYAGVSIKCPHCFEITRLIPDESLSVAPEPERNPTTNNQIPDGPWVNEPMSEKQKAMLTLYGINFREGLTKGEASKLIDDTVQTGAKPTNENQTRAAELFWKIRLNELVEEINGALTVIGNESETITSLKETKKRVKNSVRNLTDVIDKRIETIQNINREARHERTSEWLRQHGNLDG